MKIRLLFLSVFLAAFGVAVVKASESPTPSPKMVVQNAGTWVLKRGGVARQGLLIALGVHRGTFNPCNTAEFIPVNATDLSPNPNPCGSPDPAQPSHPTPIGALDSKPFVNPKLTIDSMVLTSI